MITKLDRYHFRRERVRSHLERSGLSKPRLAVRRSLKYMYAQVIVDAEGRTVAAASTLGKELKGRFKNARSVAAAKALGEIIAKKAIEKGVKEVCFDRGGRLYHGRIKALADAARQAGLKF